MRKLLTTLGLALFMAMIPTLVHSDTIGVLIKGIDDGVKTNKQQDYKEAVMNAKLQAIERAGVEISSITKVVNFQLKFDMIESESKAVLLPGFQIMDMGYQTDGTYQVVLSGKVAVGKGKPQKSPKSLLNTAAREEIKGNKYYSEHRYDKGKTHYKKALQLYDNILKSFPGSNEALKIEKESIIENLESIVSAEIIRDGHFIAPGNGTVVDTKTGLTWAARTNGSDVNWYDAKKYCENYQGGGYSDWRMPTKEELYSLLNLDGNPNREFGYLATTLIHLEDLPDSQLWASTIKTYWHGGYDHGPEAYEYHFQAGKVEWIEETRKQSEPYLRVLPVRRSR